jgi:hypothetical protein
MTPKEIARGLRKRWPVRYRYVFKDGTKDWFYWPYPPSWSRSRILKDVRLAVGGEFEFTTQRPL